ncbi:MAG: twin-arginine translocase subunit TatC [Halolamina sp.]
MSSALDEDTQQTLAEGRETAGAMLRSAQKDLQKVFVVFLVGFLGSFYALRVRVWEYLRTVTEAKMAASVAADLQIIAQTPFDVILLQAKIGLVAGILVAIPPLLYYSRDALRDRGRLPESPIPRWKLVVVAALALVLFAAGMAYGYGVFFPFMFDFLAGNALAAGFSPHWSIVLWTQFIVLLSVSFGLAAQMPLAMTGLASAGIVPYRTFREKWRHAVLGIFVFGAMFSPPDPFTQVMWAAPLLFLYGFSLYLTRVVVTAQRGGDRLDPRAVARRHWNVLAGVFFGGAAAVYLFYTRGGPAAVNDLLRAAGSDYRVLALEAALGLSPTVTLAVFGTVAGAVALVVALLVAAYREVDLDDAPSDEPATGDPTGIDLAALDADGVRAAPPEAFAELSEEAALQAAQDAIDADRPEKAEAILDRWDEADAAAADDPPASDDDSAGPEPTRLYDPDAGVFDRLRDGAGWVNWSRRLRDVWNLAAAVAVVVFGVGYALVAGRSTLSESVLPALGASDTALPDPGAALGVSEPVALGLVAVAALVAAGSFVAVVALIAAYQAGTDPTALDLDALTEAQLRAAPTAAFAALSETEANFYADRAAAADRPERAAIIYERFDDAQAAATVDGEATADADAAATADSKPDPSTGSVGDRAQRAGGTFLDELTDGDADEDDVGGYYTDVRFVLDSLTSRAFRIVGVFMAVLAATFGWLYTGGIGRVYNGFLSRVPGEVTPDTASVIALHPVEALIFEVKFSALIAVMAVAPLVGYYAWPALRERGFVRGRRNVVFGWTAALAAGLVGGFALGYLFVAPTIISYLVFDALQANMVISYRITNFFWLIFFTTAGIGILVDVPVFMVLLNTAGVSYQAMRGRWREVTVGMLTFAALFTPADIVTMFLVTVPLMTAYGVGLSALFVLTLGGRRNLTAPRVGDRASG